MSTAALLYFCTELRCLEITPDDNQFVLDQGSSLTLTCSSSGEAAWEKLEEVPDFQTLFFNLQSDEKNQTVQSSATSRVLTLSNVNWMDTGVYQCTDRYTGETKAVAVFVPGEDVELTNNFTRNDGS